MLSLLPLFPCPRIHPSSPHTPGSTVTLWPGRRREENSSPFLYPVTSLHRIQSTLGCPAPTHPPTSLCLGPIPANFSSPQKASFLESAPPPSSDGTLALYFSILGTNGS